MALEWLIPVHLSAALLLLLPTSFSGGHQGEADDTSLSFSHSTHLEQPGVGCPVCHRAVIESEKASDNNLPKEESCLDCHERSRDGTCLPCHTTPEQASPLTARNWTLHFSHRIHLQQPDLMLSFFDQLTEEKPGPSHEEEIHRDATTRGCMACHDEMASAAEGSLKNYPTMKNCLACHEVEGDAMNHCSTCHFPDVDLFPKDHQGGTFFDDHSSETANHDSGTCQMCHTPGFNPCTQCH